MLVDPDILHLRSWNDELLVGPEPSFGERGGCRRESGAGVEALLRQSLIPRGGLHALKRMRTRWEGRLGGTSTDDRRLIARVVAGVDRGSLLAYRAIGGMFAARVPASRLTPDILKPFEPAAQIRSRVAAPNIPAARVRTPESERDLARQLEKLPVELRLAEVFRRTITEVPTDFAEVFPPSRLAPAVAVLAAWADESRLRANVILHAVLRANGFRASARAVFALVEDIDEILTLAQSARFDATLDEAAAKLALVLNDIGSVSFLSVTQAGAERINGVAHGWSPPKPTPVRQVRRRPLPEEDGLPSPRAPSPPAPPKPPTVPAVTPTLPVALPDSPACAAAKVAKKKLDDLKDEARLADHAYMTVDERKADPIKDYAPILEEEALNELGLSKKNLELDGTAFQAVVYRNLKDNSIVVAFKGTDFSKMSDLQNNAAQALNIQLDKSYYKQAQKIAAKLRNQFSDVKPLPVKFIGHSLGGGLASAAARAAGTDATTFNAAGLHSKTVEKVIEGGRITAVHVKGEILTSIQRLLPLPEAASDGDVISLDPPPGIGKDTVPSLLSTVAGKIPGLAQLSLAVGMLKRSGMLHKMGVVQKCLDDAILKAEKEVSNACG